MFNAVDPTSGWKIDFIVLKETYASGLYDYLNDRMIVALSRGRALFGILMPGRTLFVGSFMRDNVAYVQDVRR